MQRLELKIPPVAVFLVFGALMWVAARVFTRASFSFPGAALIAVILGTTGAAIGVMGILAFRRNETTVHPNYPEKSSTIVTEGIYRHTRNPMYLGLALILTAWASKLGNPVSLLGVPAFIAYITRFQIMPEERVLLSRFGSPFGEYMDSVRRWM